MRKIDHLMLDAVRKRRRFVSGKTSVVDAEWGGRTDQMEIALHNNIIAILIKDTMTVQLVPRTFADWPTTTTRARLCALGFKASIKNGMPYIDGKPLDITKTYEVKICT